MQVTLWDMSVEEDTEAVGAGGGGDDVPEEDLSLYPPQLLFIHQGQTDVKEVHFHKQIPGMLVSTAADGFNFFVPNITVAPEAAATDA